MKETFYRKIWELYQVDKETVDLIEQAQGNLWEQFARIDAISQLNQLKILGIYRDENIAPRFFAPSTGYGYDDIGRDKLDVVFARALGAEDALVRPQITSGTHALAMMLFGLLLPGDELLCATGKPYDTLETAIGISGDSPMSLARRNVTYAQAELLEDGSLDANGILAAIKPNTKVIHFQRSRGYAWRRALTVKEIGEMISAIKEKHPNVIITVDNCYGEFTAEKEPTELGADVIAGSLIKNPGGGIAPTGGYIAGRKDLIEQIADCMTAPGIGREVGSYAATYRPFYQGLFMAPHVVAQSQKAAVLAAKVFAQLGYEVLPGSDEPREDIIQSIKFGAKEPLIAFCKSIQRSSPVDSFAAPEPWDMPGYQHQVIMAAGAFVQGSSIELSADAPIKEPYIAYMQGGLTYEHAKLAIMTAVADIKRAVK